MARGAKRWAGALALATLMLRCACTEAVTRPPAVAVVPVTVVITVVTTPTPRVAASLPGDAPIARQTATARHSPPPAAASATPAAKAQRPVSLLPTLPPLVDLSATAPASLPTVTTLPASVADGASTTPIAAITNAPTTTTPVTVTSNVAASPLPPPAIATQPAVAPPVVSLSAAPVAAAEPRISETTITIPTYDYAAAFLPTAPDDPVYPYPRLDPARVGPPVPRAYRAVVLENGFVAVTILPELGGRIYRWVDKTTGQNLLYENPVIKPTGWGYRGWWLATGGIEWAFPVEEHGLNEYRPWQVSTGSTPYGLAVTVSDVDSRTGMEVGATVSLDAGHAWITLEPWARNLTAEAKPYQLWLNAMLALNGNTMSGQTRFVVPAAEVIVHSTGDGGAPGSGGTMGWPLHNGRDMSLYGNWSGYLGFFAPNVAHGFTGIYDVTADQGVVRVFNPGWPAGTKIFGPATLPSGLWTDDGSGYVELWSGATSSFWSAATLGPGETFSWTEQWYPVHGLGGLTFANRVAALWVAEMGGFVEARVATPATFSGRARLLVGEQSAGEWPVTIYPGQVLGVVWNRPPDSEGPARLQLLDGNGAVVAHTGP